MDLMNYQKVIKKLLFLLIIFFIIGCTNKNDINKLYGKWKSLSGNMMFIFNKDNTCKEGIYDKKNNKEYLSSCTYEINNNNIILTSGDEKEIYIIGFKNNNLVLTTEDQSKIELKKSN